MLGPKRHMEATQGCAMETCTSSSPYKLQNEWYQRVRENFFKSLSLCLLLLQGLSTWKRSFISEGFLDVFLFGRKHEWIHKPLRHMYIIARDDKDICKRQDSPRWKEVEQWGHNDQWLDHLCRPRTWWSSIWSCFQGKMASLTWGICRLVLRFDHSHAPKKGGRLIILGLFYIQIKENNRDASINKSVWLWLFKTSILMSNYLTTFPELVLLFGF